jgi:nitrite reductase (NADH) small subunit
MERIRLCSLDAIPPGRGACALVGVRQVALFRPRADEQVYALDNIDPFISAWALPDEAIVEHLGEFWAMGSLKRLRFRLRDGLCLENPGYSVLSLPVEVRHGVVYLLLQKAWPT